MPAGVTSATFDLYGARGSGAAGRGGRVTATLAVTPGNVYQIRVGGSGPFGASYNGGGRAGSGRNISGGSGGGASDVRNGAFALADRLLAAAAAVGLVGPMIPPSGAMVVTRLAAQAAAAARAVVAEPRPPAAPVAMLAVRAAWVRAVRAKTGIQISLRKVAVPAAAAATTAAAALVSGSSGTRPAAAAAAAATPLQPPPTSASRPACVSTTGWSLSAIR